MFSVIHATITENRLNGKTWENVGTVEQTTTTVVVTVTYRVGDVVVTVKDAILKSIDSALGNVWFETRGINDE